jgi:hypothetical protein
MAGRPQGSVSVRGDARRNVRAILGDAGTLGGIAYRWCERQSHMHIAPEGAYDRSSLHGYTNHLPWDMNGRRYATRTANALHIARIGEQRGTYTTLDRTDANHAR